MLKTGTSYSNEAKPKCSHDIGPIITNSQLKCANREYAGNY